MTHIIVHILYKAAYNWYIPESALLRLRNLWITKEAEKSIFFLFPFALVNNLMT